jgi:stearoyl-CoA desaturase (delta-9 desaturase)
MDRGGPAWGGAAMPIYNVVGYTAIGLHVLAAGLTAPPSWGFLGGAAGGFGYVLLIWLVGGVYLSNVLHMGLAHRALEYPPWFVKGLALVNNTVAIYVDPTGWVNRHRHHHAFSDRPGDPNKLPEDGFWKTLYLCLVPYPCRSNLATDPIFRTAVMRLVSSSYFAAVSVVLSYGLLWLVVGDWRYALALWVGARVTALWVNLIQNYWTHDRRFGTRRYPDDDNAMNIGDWLPVTATFGACLQNNHHHFPRFLRCSHDPDEYDWGFTTVRAMRALGLVRATAAGLRRPEGIPLREVGW